MEISISCDFEDSKSVSEMIKKVLESCDSINVSKFRIESNLPFSLNILSDPAKKGISSKAFAVSAYNKKKLLGITTSPKYNPSHRYLEAKESISDYKRGRIAHVLLSVISDLEGGYLEREEVKGYDLIIFYIREGYFPLRRQSFVGMKGLKEELANYLENKENFDRDSLPTTILAYGPKKAQAYFEELKELSGYVESK